MIEVYLPIAEITVHLFYLLFLGFLGGVLSGWLGLSGGVIVTPGLMFLHVEPFVVIASQMVNAVGLNFSGFLASRTSLAEKKPLFSCWFLIANILLGGITGALVEFFFLRSVHAYLSYQVILFSYSFMLFVLGLFTVPFRWKTSAPHKRFVKAFFIGFFSSLFTSIFGGGNNLFILPSLLFFLSLPKEESIRITLFCSFMITGLITLLHAVYHDPPDLVLTLFLFLGGYLGVRLGAFLRARKILARQTLFFSRLILFSLSGHFFISAFSARKGKNNMNFDDIYFFEKDSLFSVFTLKFSSTYPLFYTFCSILLVCFLCIFLRKSQVNHSKIPFSKD